MKKKAIGGLISIAKISKFFNRESKLKLVHGLILTPMDFCNALLSRLPSTDLHGRQMFLSAAVRFIVNKPRYNTEWITPRAFELHFLPVKARIEYNICLLAHKYILSGGLRHINNLLQPVLVSSLRSWASNRLIEPVFQEKLLKSDPFASVHHVCTTSYRLSCALLMTCLLLGKNLKLIILKKMQRLQRVIFELETFWAAHFCTLIVVVFPPVSAQWWR